MERLRMRDWPGSVIAEPFVPTEVFKFLQDKMLLTSDWHYWRNGVNREIEVVVNLRIWVSNFVEEELADDRPRF